MPSPVGTEPIGWLVEEDVLAPPRLRGAESVFTVGNGVFCTRGTFEERYPGDEPATLMHGIFGSHPIAGSELANLPNWTALQVTVDGEPFSMVTGTILAYRRELDLRSGLLRREVTWKSPGGRTVGLVFERFASLADPQVAAVRVRVTALDDPIAIIVRASLPSDASTSTTSHLEPVVQRAADGTASIVTRVRATPLVVAMAARFDVHGVAAARDADDLPGDPGIVARWDGSSGETATFEKVVVVASSRRVAHPHRVVTEHLAGLEGSDFGALHAASTDAWKRDWAMSDVVIEGDPEAQLAARFSVYHLLIAAPRDDDQVSIGARTLSGFGYHGHVFWDTETFMLPFFTHVHPAIARNLLSYRYHRLPGARRKAAANGFEGAQIPWESAETGDEVTPKWVGDPGDSSRLVRIWTGDIEIHISAMVAHAVMTYWRATGDDAFMLARGVELVLETARFWQSRAEWNDAAERYEFTDVIGPDEYHEHVDNNAFTNHLAAWHLRTAADLVVWVRDAHPTRAATLHARPEEAAGFRSVADAIYVSEDPATGLVEQFDGYFGLQDVDLAGYADRSSSMQSILGMDGVAQTQVIKQPDVLMLPYLLPELMNGVEIAVNYAYYTPRTDHSYGSSLGPAMQALVAARVADIDQAYGHLMRAARADLGDVRGNAGDGIHAASAGGLWQALVFGFAGVRFEDGEIVTDARLPAQWHRLAFRLVHRGRTVDVDLRHPPADVSPASAVKGLIFDLDGVITDTAELHYRAWQRLADDIGAPFDRRANEALRGISRRESLRRVLGARSVSETEAQAMMDRKNGYYRDLLKDLTPADILPGATELLAAARRRGLRLALASASRNAREVLDRLGIADRFDAVCDGSTVSAAKPAPDLFLAAAAALDLAPDECVVFEDATEGVAAAHAAGMAAVGIGPVERVGMAEMVIDGVADADLEAIVRLRAGARVA